MNEMHGETVKSGDQSSSVMRTFVRARLGKAPEFARTMGGVGVCRLVVIGEASGPTSSPPRVSLYIGDGGPGLRHDEARRCAFGLRAGDLIQTVGDIGPERLSGHRQEVVVREPVKLRERAESTGGAA